MSRGPGGHRLEIAQHQIVTVQIQLTVVAPELQRPTLPQSFQPTDPPGRGDKGETTSGLIPAEAFHVEQLLRYTPAQQNINLNTGRLKRRQQHSRSRNVSVAGSLNTVQNTHQSHSHRPSASKAEVIPSRAPAAISVG